MQRLALVQSNVSSFLMGSKTTVKVPVNLSLKQIEFSNVLPIFWFFKLDLRNNWRYVHIKKKKSRSKNEDSKLKENEVFVDR